VARNTGQGHASARAPLHRRLGPAPSHSKRRARDGDRACGPALRAGDRTARALVDRIHHRPRRGVGWPRPSGLHPPAEPLGPTLARTRGGACSDAAGQAMAADTPGCRTGWRSARVVGRVPGAPYGQACRGSRQTPDEQLLPRPATPPDWSPELARLLGIPIPPPPGPVVPVPARPAGASRLLVAVRAARPGTSGSARVQSRVRCITRRRALNRRPTRRTAWPRGHRERRAVDGPSIPGS